MNEYAYKMEGLDKEWTFLKSNRKVYYTKLAPGNYIFRVKGSNSSGVWNNNKARIDISIYPPWWGISGVFPLCVHSFGHCISAHQKLSKPLG